MIDDRKSWLIIGFEVLMRIRTHCCLLWGWKQQSCHTLLISESHLAGRQSWVGNYGFKCIFIIVHCSEMAARVIVWTWNPLPQFQSRPCQLWWWWSFCFWFWFCKPANQARLVQCLVSVRLKRFLGDGTVNVKLVLNTQDTTNNSHTRCIVLYYRFTIPTSLNVRLSSSSLSPSWPWSSSSSSSLLRSSQCDLLGGHFV